VILLCNTSPECQCSAVQRCYQDQGVRDQDQTGRDQDQDQDQDQTGRDRDRNQDQGGRDQNQDHKTSMVETKTKTRDRDRYLCCLGHDQHTQTVFIYRHLNIALQ